ncbi:MAG TPA: ankyrin repeat domain-containing protein [Nitrospiraceae bacterium]|nr:ankyrin repeat domain-containing protein [Nitrospiraceae bacterium]
MSSQDYTPAMASAVEAIHSGNVEFLKQLLNQNRNIVRETVDGQRTLLHVATDWPGHFPNNAAIVAALASYGADINAAFIGRHSETPLHWAASTNDVAVLDVLIDNGADVEAPGGVIGGGTPLADAVAFGQWQAAHRLVERGARTTLWQAAALGLMDRVKEYFAGDAAPAHEEITNAFWCACHGGQQTIAAYLLGHGAELNWVGHDGLSPLDAASRTGAVDVIDWLRQRGAKSASH